MMVYFLLLLLTLLPGSTSANIVTNRQFYPEDVEGNAKRCDIPPYQDKETVFRPTEGVCSGLTTLSNPDEARIQELAEAYAPYLFFHPLENFTMSSVERTLGNASQGSIFLSATGEPILFDEELNLTSMMETTRNPDYVLHSNKFFFEHDLNAEYVAGDGFFENGISKAPIYYNAYDSGDGTITFNYFFYFIWNGPASLGVISSINGVNEYVPFELPPNGVHEGDWESMSVTVCPSDPGITIPGPLSVAYRQSGFGQVLDCGKGECVFYRDSATHPVGFVSLNEHDVYPLTVTELVYGNVVGLEFFVNLQNVLLVSRLAYADERGNYRYFAPSFANVLRLPDQEDIPMNVNETEYWAAYGGNWGRTEPDLRFEAEQEYPICLNNDTTQVIDCPTEEENEIFILVLQLLRVNEPSSLIVKGATALTTFLIDFFTSTAVAPTGPATNGFYTSYGVQSNAPVWKEIPSNTTGRAFCDSLFDIPDTYRLPVDMDSVPFVQNVVGVVAMFLFFTTFNVVYGLKRRNVPLRPVILQDENGNYLPPDKLTRRWVFLCLWSYAGAYCFSLISAALFFSGHGAVTTLVNETFALISVNFLDSFFLGVGVFCFLTNTLLLFVIWFISEELWLRLNRTCCHLNRDDEGLHRFQCEQHVVLRYFLPTDEYLFWARIAFYVLFSALLLSFMLSVFMVVAGTYNVGFAFMFGTICRALIGSLDGKCFNLPSWGEIQCGADFQEFCRDWARVEMMVTLWGGFGVIVGHFYLIAFSAATDIAARNTNRALILYGMEHNAGANDKAVSQLLTVNETRSDEIMATSNMETSQAASIHSETLSDRITGPTQTRPI